MVARCSYCGCILTYRAHPIQEGLATKAQRAAIFAEAGASGDRSGVRDRLADYGYREVWGILSQCPGCGVEGSRFNPFYQRREVAEAVVAKQNRAADSAEAVEAAAHWREEVRRRAVLSARLFANLLLFRFPEWKPYLLTVPAEEERNEGEWIGVKWDCALIARIPSENPSVDALLLVLVRPDEVSIEWGDILHNSVSLTWDTENTSLSDLQKAVNSLEQMVSERIFFIVYYSDGERIGGGYALGSANEPLEWPDGVDRIIHRSWLGTYERVMTAEEDAPV